jgi:hypothetical protein
VAGNGPVEILSGTGCPNPNPRWLLVDLASSADVLDFEVFTKAEILCLRFSQTNVHAGWNQVPAPQELATLADGIYYIRAQAYRGQAESSAYILKVMIVR